MAELMKVNNAALVGITVLITLLIFAVGYSFPYANAPIARAGAWLIIMLLMVAFVAVLGLRICERPDGVFINERFKMTLSRFQLVIWTIIVLSAFVTIALERVQAGTADPLAIALPTQLWALLGISTASLVGSPLVLSTKVPKKPTDEAISRAADLEARRVEKIPTNEVVAAQTEYDKVIKNSPRNFVQVKDAKEKLDDAIVSARKDDSKVKEFAVTQIEPTLRENVQVSGTLDSNKDATEATFSEMFMGDEIGNKNVIDMAKMQMFFFTLLIAFSYAVLLIQLIVTQEPSKLTSFPQLSDGAVALLGISSAGYLASKATDHTKTEQ